MRNMKMCQARYFQKIWKIIITAQNKILFTLLSRTYITYNRCFIQKYSVRRLSGAFYMSDWSKCEVEDFLSLVWQNFENKWRILNYFHKSITCLRLYLIYKKHPLDVIIHTSFLIHLLDAVFMSRWSKT